MPSEKKRDPEPILSAVTGMGILVQREPGASHLNKHMAGFSDPDVILQNDLPYTDYHEADALQQSLLSAMRPKIGLSPAARKKKAMDTLNEHTEAETSVSEETAASVQEKEVDLFPASEETTSAENNPAQAEIVLEPLDFESLQDPDWQQPYVASGTSEEKDPSGWNAAHIRPWNFKSILAAVALFVGITLGFMAFFSSKPRQIASGDILSNVPSVSPAKLPEKIQAATPSAVFLAPPPMAGASVPASAAAGSSPDATLHSAAPPSALPAAKSVLPTPAARLSTSPSGSAFTTPVSSSADGKNDATVDPAVKPRTPAFMPVEILRAHIPQELLSIINKN